MRYLLGFGLWAMLAPVQALASAPRCGVDLQVSFIEGAPVDRFVISNTGAQAVALHTVTFDLTPSRGKLIFDTKSGGAGVEVFQPFNSDNATLDVPDGATGLKMALNGLAAGADVVFSIDVDDQLTNSDLGQIRVSGSEMAGAQVTFSTGDATYVATFDEANVAQVSAGCIG